MTTQFDLSYYDLADNCGTQALITLGVSKKRLEVFTKIVKLHFYSDLLGFHSLPQKQSAWTVEGLSIAIKYFKLPVGIIVREAGDNYLLFPAGRVNKFILLDNYHYSVIQLDMRHLFSCKQMCDYHFLHYGYGKKDRQVRKYQIATSKVPLSKDTRTIWRAELLPSYGYNSDDLKDSKTRDYNKKHYKKFPKKFSSTAFDQFLPKRKRVFTYGGAHDYAQFILDLLVSFSTIKTVSVLEVARATYLFLRTRGIQLADFYFLCKDSAFFVLFKFDFFSRYVDKGEVLITEEEQRSDDGGRKYEDQALKDTYKMLVTMKNLSMTYDEFYEKYTSGSLSRIWEGANEYIDARREVSETRKSVTSVVGGENFTFSSKEEFDISFLSKSKETMLWPFVSQLLVSLLALAFSSAASCAVSREKLNLINTCVLQSCNKLDVYGLLQWAMEALKSHFPFVSSHLPAYQTMIDKAYAKSQFFKIKSSVSVNNVALNFKDFFQSGESYYDAIVELLDKYPKHFTSKELVELNKLKAAAYSSLQNGKPRMPPFSVGLIGGSAQGKTTCIHRLKAVFAAVYKRPGDEIIDLEKYKEVMRDNTKNYKMFNLNVADPYVSGYTDQDMIVFDDAGATKPEFVQNPELSFILQAINGINTPTLQAAVENKGNVYFKNTSFVITSNNKFFGSTQTMTCPQAVLRRFNLVAEVRMNPKIRSDDKIVDCYVVTPYRVNILRHDDFSQENWEYSPVLGYDQDSKPKTCRWSDFENLVYKEALAFKSKQEVIMESQKEVIFCKECMSTFCYCGHRSDHDIFNPFSNNHDPSLNPLPDIGEGEMKSSDQEIKWGSFSPTRTVFETGDCSWPSQTDTFSSTSSADFLGGFVLCMAAFWVYHYTNRIVNRVLETVEAVDVVAERITTSVSQLSKFTNAFIRVGQSVEQRIEAQRIYWTQRYHYLKQSLQLSRKAKTFLLVLIGGVIGIIAGGFIYKKFIEQQLTKNIVCENDQKTTENNQKQESFSSNAFFESVQSKTSTRDSKQKMIFNNVWRVEIFSQDGLHRSSVSMLAIGGRHALIVNHFMKKFLPGMRVILTKCIPGKPDVVIKTWSSEFEVLDRFMESDLALVEIKTLPLSMKITDFVSKEIPNDLEIWRAPKTGERYMINPLLNHRKTMEVIHTDQADPHCIIFHSAIPIERGHCGSLIICVQTQNIVGMVVGSSDQDNTFGIFVPIPQIRIKPEIIDIPIPFQVGNKATKFKEVCLDNLKFSSVESTLEVIASVENYPRPSATKVRRTALDESVEKLIDPLGDVFGVRHKPTPELDPVNLGNHKPQMGKAVKRALDVLETVGTPFDTEELRNARIQYTVRVAKVLKNFKPEELRIPCRVLSFDEAVLGEFQGNKIPGVNSMVLNTSAGFPLGGLKSDYIVRNDDYVQYDPVFYDELQRKFDQLKRGERIHSFSVACLKDEVVKKSKIKSRLFYIVDLYNTLLARSIFSPLISLCSQFPFLTECAQGLNNHSTQWDDMYNYLSEVGTEYCFDGDYTDYDLSMPREVIQQTFEFVFWFLGWCGYNEQDLLVAKTFAQELIEPNVFLGPILYRWFRGWISGNILTFIGNSISNSIIDRATYKALTQRNDFDQQVRTVKGGDDVITSYTGVDRRYNMNAIMFFLKEKGFIYTSAMKDGVCLEYKNLDQCQFFKRNFVREGDKMLSPIDPNSIVKMLMWTDSDRLHEQLLGSVESALREAFHYGREYFDSFSRELELVCARTSILRGVDGDYAQYINAFGYFDYERYNNQFKRLPSIQRDYPCLVDNEEASDSDSSAGSGYDTVLSSC